MLTSYNTNIYLKPQHWPRASLVYQLSVQPTAFTSCLLISSLESFRFAQELFGDFQAV
jgi:hypothetical protein